MGMQIVELTYDSPVEFDGASIRDRTGELLGESVSLRGGEHSHSLFHDAHPVQYKNATIPAQTALMGPTPITTDSERWREERQQTWGTEHVDDVVNAATHTVMVTEFMSRGLDPHQRLRLFHAVLQATVEALPPTAMVFKHSVQVVTPDDYLCARGEPPIRRPGSLNVRFFNVDGSDGDMLMDTRGLAEIGLTDLQCHFRTLEPNEVAAVLFNTALYSFETGAQFEDGHTVQGATEGAKWRCQFEDSLIPPKRVVLDLEPDGNCAAGGRA